MLCAVVRVAGGGRRGEEAQADSRQAATVPCSGAPLDIDLAVYLLLSGISSQLCRKRKGKKLPNNCRMTPSLEPTECCHRVRVRAPTNFVDSSST
jgi:hypothetical protein